MIEEGKILVVDDTRSAVDLLVAVLSPRGFQVRTANTGPAALASVAENPPDLILVDVQMPGMDGLEVIRQLKEHESTRDIPVIFVSGVTEVDQRIEGLRLGAVDFLTKPFRHEELLARVNIHLELRRRQVEVERLNREFEDTHRGIVALQAELDERLAQNGVAEQLQSRLRSDMNHEFRTPLNSILALSRLLLDRADGELSSEEEKQVAFIRSSAEGLTVLVDNLLDLARLESGRNLVVARDGTVEEIFSGLRGMLRPLLPSSGAVKLVFESPRDLPVLHTDHGKVAQILRNLISNALKFTEQGEVRVSARLGDDGGKVLFSIADSGVGIAAEDQKRIFEDFVQVESCQAGRAKGTGLGLSISRKLATLLDGSITLESRPRKGSTFTLTIPVRHEPCVDPAPESAPLVTPDSTRHTVLVIEDDAVTRMLYEKHLAGSGFEVVAVDSIRAARRMLERIEPKAIVLDILFPRESQDGWTFLAELKTDRATRDIPVIAASVLEDVDKGMAFGAEDYCVKPVERSWLLERLQAISRRAPLEKVLIVDDDNVARYVTKGHLSDTRYAVVEASSGPEGLRLAEEQQPGAIILDLVMPEMNGLEVLHRLKENPATRDIPVIISTSQVLTEAERHLLDRQALAVLSKSAPSRQAAIENVREALRRATPWNERKAGPADGR